LRGGTHSFSNNLVVANNASLTGTGTVAGILTVQTGGQLSPGASAGTIVLSNSPVLQGKTFMEVSWNGATLTNDQIQVLGALTYGGSLLVTNIGPTALVGGNRFPLFAATSYSGSFSNLILPPLDFGLVWSNKLAVDGSIEVVSTLPPAPTLSLQFSNNVLLLTWPSNASDFALQTTFNLAPPAIWQPVTNGTGTNSALIIVNPGIPEQYFRLAFPGTNGPP
jgi:hypothetical protein